MGQKTVTPKGVVTPVRYLDLEWHHGLIQVRQYKGKIPFSPNSEIALEGDAPPSPEFRSLGSVSLHEHRLGRRFSAIMIQTSFNPKFRSSGG